MAGDGKIHIKGKRAVPNEQGVVKITQEAMQCLADITNETNMSMRQVASEIIIQAVRDGLISIDREE